jgi:hypothetical protein
MVTRYVSIQHRNIPHLRQRLGHLPGSLFAMPGYATV